MNKRILIGVMIILYILFPSCKKDKDELTNHFTYNGRTYPLDSGVLEYWGMGFSDGYNIDLTLYSSGITWNNASEGITGSGNILTFEMFSSSDSILEAGSYIYDEYESGVSGTFISGVFGISFDMDNYTGTMVIIATGTVNIIESGTEYELTFKCQAEDTVIEGYYRGPLEYFNYTAWNKSAGKRIHN